MLGKISHKATLQLKLMLSWLNLEGKTSDCRFETDLLGLFYGTQFYVINSAFIPVFNNNEQYIFFKLYEELEFILLLLFLFTCLCFSVRCTHTTVESTG